VTKVWRPKDYYHVDGCWNCDHVNRSAVASASLPICTAYHKQFRCINFGKCKRWKKMKVPIIHYY